MQQAIFVRRFDHIDALRGFAALAVCWYHLTRGGTLFPVGFARQVSSLGFLGVEVFFVISGFVIPLSLWRTDYQWADFPTYFGKRFVRIYPPFIVASLLAILLNIFSSVMPGFHGDIPKNYLSLALFKIVSDATLMTGVLHGSWIIIVAWTLAIEVQFYFLVGLIIPIVRLSKPWLTCIVLVFLSFVSLSLTNQCFVFAYLPLFTLGWTGAWIAESNISNFWAWCSLLFSLIGLLATQSIGSIIAGFVGFLFIMLWRYPMHGIFVWLGSISYSLYLIHVPVGGEDC